MSVAEKTRWGQWATDLRQKMMRELSPQVTRSIDEIAEETGTQKTTTVLHSRRFWNSCQAGKSPNDSLVKAGFEIEFEPNDDDVIENVTLRLNQTWSQIMQRVVDRQ